MHNYRFENPKEHDIAVYQTIMFIEKNLADLTQESISVYNFSLGLIYKWMMMAIEARKKDIVARLSAKKVEREERQAKIEEDK